MNRIRHKALAIVEAKLAKIQTAYNHLQDSSSSYDEGCNLIRKALKNE